MPKLNRNETKDSNALVIENSSKKKKKAKTTDVKKKHKSKESGVTKKKPLGKKKRRKLQLVLSRREKKANRSNVLAQLEELPVVKNDKLVSVTTLSHRKRVKTTKSGEPKPKKEDEDVDSSEEESVAPSPPEEAVDKDIVMSEHWHTDVLKEAVSRIDEEADLKKRRIEEIEDDDPLPFPTGSETVLGLKPIEVHRTEEVAVKRRLLPIISEEDSVLEAVATNHVCIICGATGSGKTTQVPQFLYEAGYTNMGLIGVTEPRRVAAISMSYRVAEELNVSTDVVSYKVRYEGNCTKKTKIKYMTDGVLLREVQDDFLLSKYSVLILDEAHERSEFTDILIGLLSRIVPLRKKRGQVPLKLVIMSATLRVEDFTSNSSLFKTKPPVVQIESRQFPVTAHFQKRTPAPNEYLKETFKRVCKVHRTLPAGGILVFVTGVNEINTLTHWLQATFPAAKAEQTPDPKQGAETNVLELSKASKLSKRSRKRLRLEKYGEKAEDVSIKEDKDREEDTNRDIEKLQCRDVTQSSADKTMPLYVLPLYSLLAPEEQRKVFAPAPEGSRLCVLATNVAETSLTIPNIHYVIDTGKEKRKVYDTRTGVSTFIVDWISQASADQRAGRAGRTCPGHCYRLYSSAVFSEFAKFSTPEVLARPIDDLVLMLKSFGITNVAKFPFPNAPSRESIIGAEKHLYYIGALDECRAKLGGKVYVINDLGQTIVKFGVAPRFGKMLALSNQTAKTGKSMLPYMIAIVAALTVRELFVTPDLPDPQDDDECDVKAKKAQHRFVRDTFRAWQGPAATRPLGDLVVLLNAVIEFEKVGRSPLWCKKHGLRLKAMQEVSTLRQHLTDTVNGFLPTHLQFNFVRKLESITCKEDVEVLRQMVASGLGDRVAKRVLTNEHLTKEKKDKLLSMYTKKTKEGEQESEDKKKVERNAYQAVNMESFIFIHPHSVLSLELPEYIAFQEIQETSKMYAKECMVIEEAWLPQLFPNLTSFAEPSENPPPFYDPGKGVIKCFIASSFANNAWPLRELEFDHPINGKYYKYFAMHLLKGDIFQFFADYTERLVASPSILVKPWSGIQTRAQNLLEALSLTSCTSKAKLEHLWQSDRMFLLKEFLEWLPPEDMFRVQSRWPPKS